LLELRTEQKTVSLLDNPSVQFAKKRITKSSAVREPGGVERKLISLSTFDRRQTDFRRTLVRVPLPTVARRELLAARIFVEHREQLAAAGGAGVSPNTISLLVSGEAVELSVPVFIRAQRRALQRYAGESAARTGPGQDLGVQLRVRFSR
jgi:hypothetical protein